MSGPLCSNTAQSDQEPPAFYSKASKIFRTSSATLLDEALEKNKESLESRDLKIEIQSNLLQAKDTLIQSQEKIMQAQSSRMSSGRGKASSSQTKTSSLQEQIRLRDKELRFKEDVILAQGNSISQLQDRVSCGICMKLCWRSDLMFKFNRGVQVIAVIGREESRRRGKGNEAEGPEIERKQLHLS